MLRSDDKNVVIVAEDVGNSRTVENVIVEPVMIYTTSQVVESSEPSALQSSSTVQESHETSHEQTHSNMFRSKKKNHRDDNNAIDTAAYNGKINTTSHENLHPYQWELQERLQKSSNNNNINFDDVDVNEKGVISSNDKHTCSCTESALEPVSGEVVLESKTHPSLPVSSPLSVEALAEQEEIEQKTIARNKLLARIGYFGMYAGMSGASPYYGVLLTDRGLNPSELGVVVALNPLSTLIILPYLAYIADRYKCGRQILVVTTIATTVSLFVLTILPQVPLFAVAFMMLIHFIGKCPIAPFYDQHSMAILPASRRGEWGSMRCFGGYGWGVCAPFASLLIGACGWWTAAVLYGVGYAIMMFCYDAIRLRSMPHGTEQKFSAVIGYAFVHQRILLFLIAECFMGLGYSLIGTFLFVFLKSIGAPSILLGISITMTVVVEILLFTFSRHLHSKFSDRELLAFSMVAWSFRVVCYSLLYHPWLVLLLEPLHGLTFGLMWIAGIHFVNAAFPPSLSHTANGLLSSAAFGVGPVIGNVIGGAMYSYWGPRWMFRVMALVMTLLSGVFFVIDYYLAEHGRSILALAETEKGLEKSSHGVDADNNNNCVNNDVNEKSTHDKEKKASRECATDSTQLAEEWNTTLLLQEDVRVSDESDDGNETLTSDDYCDSHKCEVSCDTHCISSNV